MKILVIEDEKRIADNIKKGLELKSMTVDVTYDGLDGFDLAVSEEYDVIILDLMLPGMDGLEICRNLRSKGKNTPILMLTARNEVESRVKGLESGADDYLGKPFNFEELLARIKALARRKENKIKMKYKVDNLVLDTSTFEVKRGEKVIKLSKKEYALLEFLMKNKGLIFSKEELADKVWSFESNILTNTAQVYIGYLRNKIDSAFPKERNLIKTVRGFGYKIE